MEPLLIDTSVWVDWFKGVNSLQTNRVGVYLAENYPIWIAPIIVQETLQGVRDDMQYAVIKSSLLSMNQFPFDPLTMAIGAADLYRDLRKKGVTIRKANDCLIAYYALSVDMTLLHNDADFDLIANHTALKASRL